MGLLLICNGGFMLLATLVSFLYEDGVTFKMFLAGLVTIIAGSLLMLTTRDHKKEIKKREGYIVVTFGWILSVSYTHLRAHETLMNLVCRLLLEKSAVVCG